MSTYIDPLSQLLIVYTMNYCIPQQNYRKLRSYFYLSDSTIKLLNKIQIPKFQISNFKIENFKKKFRTPPQAKAFRSGSRQWDEHFLRGSIVQNQYPKPKTSTVKLKALCKW